MADEIAVEEFFDVLQQSGLTPDAQVLLLKAEFSEEGKRPGSSRALADELIRRNIITDWQAQMLLQGKHRGFRLGPHRILKPLGQGGMSKVFLAEHEMMHRRCAIKVLPSKYQKDPDLLKRFQHEACAIAALDHPHIVRAYDFNKDSSSGKEIHYLAMEYVEGQDLRRMVESQGPLDYRKAADYMAQAADGLSHAHAAGFVHRDIKPANLLVDPNDVLKILDLGLARSTFEGERAWESPEEGQTAVGTADYVAPEQVADSRSVDGRADIYSLGMTFYFLLTGQRPFPKSTLVELLMAHRVEKPKPLIDFRPDVPPQLVVLFERMTAKKPDMRFQTAKEVAEAFQEWLHESPSGRYSRISELMAVAMRAKKSATAKPDEEAKAKEESELILIDDALGARQDAVEPAPTVSPKTPDSSMNLGVAKRSGPGRQKTAAPTAASENTGDSKTRLPKPSDSGKSPVLPRAKADLFSDLLSAELQPVAAGAALQPVQPVRRNEPPSVWSSPWLWIGAAVGAVAILLVAIFIFRPSNEPPAIQKPPSKSATASQPPVRQTEPKPEPLRQITKPTQTIPPEKKPDSQKPEKPQPAPVVAQSPAEKLPPKPLPELPPKQEPSEPKPAITTPPAKKVDVLKLLARIEKLSIKYSSQDPNLNSPLNVTIQRQVLDALKSLDIRLDDKAESVMQISVKAKNDQGMQSLIVSVRIKSPSPNGDTIDVWKQSRTVASFDLKQTRPDLALKQVRQGTERLFSEFTRAVERARIKHSQTH